MPPAGRGLCKRHYYALKHHGDPLWRPPERPSGCSVEDCGRRAKGRGWCSMHYARWQRHGDPLVTSFNQPRPPCSVEGCDDLAYGGGYCNKHYLRWKRHGDPLAITRKPNSGLTNEVCLVEGCGKPTKALGWCGMHYARQQLNGSLDLPERAKPPKVLCSVAGCGNEVDCRGWCDMHYQRWRNHGDPLTRLVSEITETCWHEGCERRLAKAGVCWKHYRYYKALFRKQQKGRCAICGIHEPDAPRGRLYLDHCHETGRPRAMLCHNCNVGIGHLMEDVKLLRAAIRFLQRNGTVEKVTPMPRKRRQRAEELADVIPLF